MVVKRLSPRPKSGNTSPETGGVLLELPSDEPMSEAARQRICRECERLLCLFYYLEDHGRSDDCIELLSDDPVLRVTPDVGVWKGRDSILNALKAQDEAIRGGILMVHQYHNFLLTSVSRTEAAGTAYFTMYKSVGKPGQRGPGQGYVAKLEQPMVVGETRDEFVKTARGWRIAEHEIIYVFDVDAGGDRRKSAYSEFNRCSARTGKK